MFADDLLLFGRANMYSITEIKQTLHTYEKWFGQKINYEKSSIHLSQNAKYEMKEQLISTMGINKMGSEDRYLGSNLLFDQSKKSTYQFLLEKVCSKLSSWKVKLLSHAGRLILIKTILASILVCSMAINLLSKYICRKLNAF